jgi:hypothetical protein
MTFGGMNESQTPRHHKTVGGLIGTLNGLQCGAICVRLSLIIDQSYNILSQVIVELDDLEQEVIESTDEGSETTIDDCVSVPDLGIPAEREEPVDIVANAEGLPDSEPRFLRYPLHDSVEIEQPRDAAIPVEDVHEEHGEQRSAEGYQDQ